MKRKAEEEAACVACAPSTELTRQRREEEEEQGQGQEGGEGEEGLVVQAEVQKVIHRVDRADFYTRPLLVAPSARHLYMYYACPRRRLLCSVLARWRRVAASPRVVSLRFVLDAWPGRATKPSFAPLVSRFAQP